MLVRVRTIFAVATATGLLMLAVGAPALGAPQSIAPSVRAKLLADAIATGQRNGDSHPYDIEAVSTTQVKALRAGSGETEPTCESSPACADSPVYIVAMRGRFICGMCKIPLGASVPRGTVITLIFNALTMFSSTFSLNNTYPRLNAAGTPIRLDRSRAHRRAAERRHGY
jgi:hypothetical protein